MHVQYACKVICLIFKGTKCDLSGFVTLCAFFCKFPCSFFFFCYYLTMTTTSVSSEPLSSNYLSNYASASSFHNFTRRHSIYGTEDRVVLDIGSLYLKCGFSGESSPRHSVPTWSFLGQSRDADGEVIRVNGEVILSPLKICCLWNLRANTL